jgi:hypothetical protein
MAGILIQSVVALIRSRACRLNHAPGRPADGASPKQQINNLLTLIKDRYMAILIND